MDGYGQIYWTFCPDGTKGSPVYPYGMAFRGYLYKREPDTGKHTAVWTGFEAGTPDEAFEHMEKMAEEFGIEDLRRWSGKLPDEPKYKP
jgi:hypothetical protein